MIKNKDSLSNQEIEKLNQLKEITCIDSDSLAINYLQRVGWKIEDAASLFNHEINSALTKNNVTPTYRDQQISTDKAHMLLGCVGGHLFEAVINDKMIVHKYQQISGKEVTSIAISSNKKYFFATTGATLCKFNMNSKKCIKIIKGLEISYINLTCNGQFLIGTAENGKSITLWSAKNQKLKQTWKLHKEITKTICSFDDLFIFLGHESGYISIIGLKKNSIITTVKYLCTHVNSIIMLKDKNHAIIGDEFGQIKKLQWKLNAESQNDFKITQNLKQVGAHGTQQMRVTDDEKKLIVVSIEIIKIYDFKINQTIKIFPLNHMIKTIELFENGKKMITVDFKGTVIIIDIDKLEIIQTTEGFIPFCIYTLVVI